MKLTQFIEEAQELLAEHGDLDVVRPVATAGADWLRGATLSVENYGNSDVKIVAVRCGMFYPPVVVTCVNFNSSRMLKL